MCDTYMATSTNGNSTSKVIRIHDDEKELLSRLREIYANDYRKFSAFIIKDPDVPMSIKKIYKVLDERKAYRRISDYFHRERRSGKGRRSLPSNIYARSYLHRSTTRSFTQVPESMSGVPIQQDIDEEEEDDDDDDENKHQQSNSPTMTNDSDEFIECVDMLNDDPQQIGVSSSMDLPHRQKQKLSLTNNQYQQSISPKSNLLSVRASIQKALSELDRVITTKPDCVVSDEQRQSSIQKPNLLINGHSKLDDIVRSLSNVVTQQQDNVRSIMNESSTLLVDDSRRSENVSTTQESIKHVLERLNGLVDRGHSIYDRIESIISDM